MRRENILATDKIVTALNQRRIMLAYEPVVDAQTHQGVFYECLLRIHGADGVMISQPATSCRLPSGWGLFVCSISACSNLSLRKWSRHPSLRASVNVSASSTFDPDWWARLEALLRLHTTVAGTVDCRDHRDDGHP